MCCEFLIFFIYCLLLECKCAAYQDHTIIWDGSNPLFHAAEPNISVDEGDNIVFACPRNRNTMASVFWTLDDLYYKNCQGLHMRTFSTMRRLLDCSPGQPAVNSFLTESKPREFILKVTQFSEIKEAPTFNRQDPIYFMGQNKVDNTKRTTGKVPESSYHNISEIPRQMPIEGWNRYRFLLIPAFLGLLSLIGVQTVICALWLPRRKIRRTRNLCFKRISPWVVRSAAHSVQIHRKAETPPLQPIPSQHSQPASRCREGIGSVPRHMLHHPVSSLTRSPSNTSTIVGSNGVVGQNESRQKPHQVVQFVDCPKHNSPLCNTNRQMHLEERRLKQFRGYPLTPAREESNFVTISTINSISSLEQVLANINFTQENEKVINIAV